MIKAKSILALSGVALLATGLTACASNFVPLQPAAKNVAVIMTPDPAPAQCHLQGYVTVTTTDTMPIDANKLTTTQLNALKNGAASLNANTVLLTNVLAGYNADAKQHDHAVTGEAYACPADSYTTAVNKP